MVSGVLPPPGGCPESEEEGGVRALPGLFLRDKRATHREGRRGLTL